MSRVDLADATQNHLTNRSSQPLFGVARPCRFLISVAQPANPFFHRVQVVAQRWALTHFAFAPVLRFRRDDTVFVDIESKMEFFFYWCVCLFELFKLQLPERFSPAVRAALLPYRSSPRLNMNAKHTAPFNPVLHVHPAPAAIRSRPMKRAIVAATLMVMLLPLRVHPQNKESAKPPEIKKTVDAFVGHWIITGTDTEPGAKAPVKFELTLDCKRTALGAAVTCGFAGKLPNVGPIEAATIIGYSPEEQVVRWMEISSTGEYHDHRGRWKSDQHRVRTAGIFGLRQKGH